MDEKDRKVNNYVDNERLYESFVEWYARCAEAKSKGLEEPPPPKYIVECIMLIPRHLATRGNFAGYTFKEEMISDAVLNILQYYKNFDPTKSKNPFAYFTQITYYAFLRRILREKQQAYIKHKLIKNSNIIDNTIIQDHDSDNSYTFPKIENMKMNLNSEIDEYFENKKRRKSKKKNKSIEEFLVRELEEITGNEEIKLEFEKEI